MSGKAKNRREAILQELRDTPPRDQPPPPSPAPEPTAWTPYPGPLSDLPAVLEQNAADFPGRWVRVELLSGLRIAYQVAPARTRLVLMTLGTFRESETSDVLAALQASRWPYRVVPDRLRTVRQYQRP